jgi:dimethylamine/trimethylamine dehydrogenase
VLVVGGGPAGMECARVLGERGYDVHLREAEAELGGHLRNVVRYPRMNEWGRATVYRQLQLGKMKNVEVHLGVGKMTADDVLEYGADKVVIATGSRWVENGLGAEGHSPIQGIDASLPTCLTPEQIMAGKPIPGNRVVVLDGDGHFTGISMAELAADLGKQVTLVTNMSDPAEYSQFTLEVQNNKRMMHEKGITVFRNHWADSFENGKLTLFHLYRHGWALTEPETGKLPRRESKDVVVLEVDAVILVTAREPVQELYRELKSRKGEWEKNGVQAVYRIGDCYAPRQISNATFDGHRLAREFDSPNPQYPLPWIRERQLWGAETVPKLGDARPQVEVE